MNYDELFNESDMRLRNCVPQHLLPGLDLYVFEGIKPGGCLQAILKNDLIESFSRADEAVQHGMFNIVTYLYNVLPTACYGSPDNFYHWVDNGNSQAINYKNYLIQRKKEN